MLVYNLIYTIILLMEYEIDNFNNNPEGFTIIKYLIDKNQTKHIPYYSYDETDYNIERTILNNDRRLDSIVANNIDINEIKHNINEAIQWLYNNLWVNYAIHGDLTSNNIIYQNRNIYFIDWNETSSIYNSSVCTIWFILADIIDFLNSFYEIFPELLTEVTMDEFNNWYNLIKNQEDNMKTNGTDENLCKQEFNTNIEALSVLFRFLLTNYNIDMNKILELNNMPSIIGGKKRKKTRRRIKRTKTKRRYYKKYLKTY